MNDDFSIITRLKDAIESLEDEQYKKCKIQLESLADDIQKFNIDNNLKYLRELEDNLE